MKETIPDCYEADRQAEARDFAHTLRIMRRPCCRCCDEHITTETCLDLSDLGFNGEYLCEKCIADRTVYTHELDEADG